MKNEQIKRLLVAEDDKDCYNNFISAIFRLSESIDVMRVDDGYSLFTMLQTNIDPQAIFLDINMKYKNGLIALREIKETNNWKTLPVIMLSSSDYPINIDLAFRYGATFFVRKPDSADKLAKTLDVIFSSEYFRSGLQPPKEHFYVT